MLMPLNLEAEVTGKMMMLTMVEHWRAMGIISSNNPHALGIIDKDKNKSNGMKTLITMEALDIGIMMKR